MAASTRIDNVAVAGIGETGLCKRGQAGRGSMALCLQAIMAASEDAGIDVRDIDGFASYGENAHDGPEFAVALGVRDLRWSTMVWGGGGGGVAAAIGQAATAIAAGVAERVIVLRGHAEESGGRLGEAVSSYYMSAHYRAHGIVSPAQICALRTQRLIEHDGVSADTMRAIAQAGYRHAANNPRAVGRDVILDDETYAAARWIAEPYRLFDCSRENDGAAALLLTRADATQRPVHLVAVSQGAGPGWGQLMENEPEYSSSGYSPLAQRLWADTGLHPPEIDVVQVYENFSGTAVASLIDHGFCDISNANDFLTVDNLTAPGGELPINTAGGNGGEGFLHGMNLALEAVRQLRDESPNPVPGADLSMLISGPMAPYESTALFARSAL